MFNTVTDGCLLMSSLATFSVRLTCTEGGEDDSVVERLRRSVVVLQKHPVRVLRFTGVQYRLHLQELWWRGQGCKETLSVFGYQTEDIPPNLSMKDDHVESSSTSVCVWASPAPLKFEPSRGKVSRSHSGSRAVLSGSHCSDSSVPDL